MTRRAIYKLAKKLQRSVQCGDPLTVIRNRKRIQIAYRNDFVRQRGFSTLMLGNYFIIVNANMSREMQLQVIAHELAHILLHKEEYHKSTDFRWITPEDFWHSRNVLEEEANLFVASFLIWNNDLRECIIDKGYSLSETARALNVSPEYVTLMIELMNEFEGTQFVNIEHPQKGFLADIPDLGEDDDLGYYPDPDYDDFDNCDTDYEYEADEYDEEDEDEEDDEDDDDDDDEDEEYDEDDDDEDDDEYDDEDDDDDDD